MPLAVASGRHIQGVALLALRVVAQLRTDTAIGPNGGGSTAQMVGGEEAHGTAGEPAQAENGL